MSSSQCPGIPDNTDLTGIGIRVSFYIQVLMAHFIAYLPDSETDASYWTMTTTAVALFISGLVLNSAQNLSLFHGILISFLLSLHAGAAFNSVTSASFHHKPQDEPSELAHQHFLARFKEIPSAALATAFGFVIWRNPASFGAPSECNDEIVIALLWWKVSALSVGRGIGLAVAALQASILLWTLITFAAYLFWYDGENAKESSVLSYLLFPGPYKRKSFYFIPFSMFGMAVVLVVLIIVIELTIKANTSLIIDQSADRTWTLGQIFPVIMLAVPTLDLIRWLFGRFKEPTEAEGMIAEVMGLANELRNNLRHNPEARRSMRRAARYARNYMP